MKKILLGVMAALALVGCKTDNSDHPHIDTQAAKVATVIPMTDNQLILSKEKAKDNITFSWKPAEYGYSAAVKYIIQADVAGGTFTNPIDLAVADGTTGQIPVATLNTLLVNKFKFTPAKSGETPIVYQFDIRIASYISQNIKKIYSTSSSINVVTYQDKVVIPSLGLPGDYTQVGGGNWNPANVGSRLWDRELKSKYVGYVSMTDLGAGGFKVVDGTTWDVQYTSPSGISKVGDNYEATLEATAKYDNIQGLVPGYFKVTVDMSAVPFTFTAWQITSIGITGSITEPQWDPANCPELKYNNENGTWEAVVDLVDGEFLFVVNKTWTKFGVKDGKLTFGDGDNIKGPGTGKYKVVLNISGEELTFGFIPQ